MNRRIVADFRKSQLQWLMEDPSERTLNIQGDHVIRSYWHHGADSVILSGQDLPEGFVDMDTDDVYTYVVSIIEERLDG